MLRSILAGLALLLALAAGATPSPERPKYSLRYSAEFLPSGAAAIEITTQPGSGRLIALDLDMPTAIYSAEAGDGSVERRGERVLWTPPLGGGSLRYRVRIDDQRDNGEFDSRITTNWVITRGDRLFPAAKVRATKGSGSTATLQFKLPQTWDDVETPFAKVSGGAFAVTNPERRFDRPTGWIAAGKLTSIRETIAGTRVTVSAPEGEPADQLPMLAMLRQVLPEMLDAFNALPEKLLIVRAGDPMWRGGLSARSSLWLHAQRPLISQNGTSPILHELTHVFTGIRGGAEDDWIAEGLAEFYSLEIGRRSGQISEARFAKSIRSAARSGAKVSSLHAAESSRDRTRKAVALFAALDIELRAKGSSIDALTRLLMRRETVSLADLRDDTRKLEGQPSALLAVID